MRKKVFSVMFLVIALIVGAWSIPYANASRALVAQPKLDSTSSCDHAAAELVGRPANLPHIKGLIHDTCDFHVKINQVDKHVSEFDKDFIEDAITSNTLELQSLQIALSGATNAEWRGLIMMMIDQHTSDLQQAIVVAKKIGVDTKPDLTHAAVYPETPDYDLGKRYENLVEKYLNPLMAAAPGGGIGTPTGVPTDTATATGIPTDTATGIPIPTGTGTVMAIPTPTGTSTGIPADTATSLPTDTATSTDTPTATSTDTATALPTDTDTPTGVPTNTPTPVSGGGGTGALSSFEILSIHIIEDEHEQDVQAELVAERLTQNDEIRAFAKHGADVTQLHIMLMDDLKHRLVDNYTPPDPQIQADYQGPRKFEPR